MKFGSLCKPVGKAKLVGWQLELREFANIVPGNEVYGVLWEIDGDTLSALDNREGCPDLYFRGEVNVFHETETYRAIVYIMTCTNELPTCAPSHRYVHCIMRGYTEFDIPANQLTTAINSLTTRLNYENQRNYQ